MLSNNLQTKPHLTRKIVLGPVFWWLLTQNLIKQCQLYCCCKWMNCNKLVLNNIFYLILCLRFILIHDCDLSALLSAPQYHKTIFSMSIRCLICVSREPKWKYCASVVATSVISGWLKIKCEFRSLPHWISYHLLKTKKIEVKVLELFFLRHHSALNRRIWPIFHRRFNIIVHYVFVYNFVCWMLWLFHCYWQKPFHRVQTN